MYFDGQKYSEITGIKQVNFLHIILVPRQGTIAYIYTKSRGYLSTYKHNINCK